MLKCCQILCYIAKLAIFPLRQCPIATIYLVEEGREPVVSSVRQQPVSWLRDLAILALL